MLLIGSAFVLAACLGLFVILGLVKAPEEPLAVLHRVKSMSRGEGAEIFSKGDSDSLGRLRIVTVPTLIERAERNIKLSGHKAGWTLRRLMMGKVVAATVVGFILATYWLAQPSGQRFTLFLLGTLVAFFFPDIWLNSRAKERQEQIVRELPDTLDQTVIAIESGLSFEGALQRVAATGTGPLAEEFTRTLQDMQLGMSRRAAYNSLADRTSAEDLKRFCKQITQAEEFGVSIAQVVRNLAKEMRLKRKYRAEEIAQKIPVKMIFPLATCFMPVLFIIILFPVGYGLAQQF